MRKKKNINLEMQATQDLTEEMAISYGSQDFPEYDPAEVQARENAQKYAGDILDHHHTVTEEYTGLTKKIYKVNITKIKEMFPATDGAYLDWNAFISATEGAIPYVAEEDIKKALERLLDIKYTTRLRWLPPAVGVTIN